MMDEISAPMTRWMSNALSGARIVNAHKLSGGYRYENIAVVTDRDETFVLRRYRVGDRCGVEQALAHKLTGLVPVPEMVAADTDGSSAGEPVLLSRFVPGARLDTIVTTLDVRDAARLGSKIGSVLAAIGSVEFGAAGFFSGPDLTIGETESVSADLVAFTHDRVDGMSGLTVAEKAALLELAAGKHPCGAT